MAHRLNRARTVVVSVVVAVLSVVAAWQFARSAVTAVRLSFADEQTKVFFEMTAQAAEALRQEPPDVGFLEYAHSYYPSGTKQQHGSILDKIVERSRLLAESRIMDMLRHATSQDYGSNAEAWIRAFRGPDSFEGVR